MKTTNNGGLKKPKNTLPLIHPGEVIKHDILPEVGLSVTAAAKALGVSRQMLHAILSGRKALSAIMCLKVARLFGGPPELWMRLQATYDLKKSAQNKKIMESVTRIVPLTSAVDAHLPGVSVYERHYKVRDQPRL